jgi:hypothetical protein
MPGADDTVLQIARGTARLLADLGYATLAEFPLRSGRRTDLLGLGRKGEVVIVEVKSSPADFRSDRKWPEYLEWCDAFYFAVAEDFPHELLPADHGLIIADGFGAALRRESAELGIAPARRKALTLRFARLAGQRLQQQLDAPF